MNNREQLISFYRSQNMRIIPQYVNGATPISWSEYRDKDYLGNFEDNQNIAFIPCNNIVVFDVDFDINKELMNKIFPDCTKLTLVVKSRKGWHIYYKTNEKLEPTAFYEGDRKMIEFFCAPTHLLTLPDSKHREDPSFVYHMPFGLNPIETRNIKPILAALENSGLRKCGFKNIKVEYCKKVPESRRHLELIVMAREFATVTKCKDLSHLAGFMHYQNDMYFGVPKDELDNIVKWMGTKYGFS